MRKTLVVAVAVCALVVAGCGGGGAKKTSAKTWTSKFCGAMATWEQSAISDSVKFKSLLSGLQASGNQDLTNVRAQMLQFFARLVTESEQLRDNVKAAGPPDMKNGDKIQHGMTVALSGLAAEFVKEKQKIAKLPTANQLDFATQASAISNSISTRMSRLGSAISGLDKYRTAEFKKAWDNDPTCKKI